MQKFKLRAPPQIIIVYGFSEVSGMYLQHLVYITLWNSKQKQRQKVKQSWKKWKKKPEKTSHCDDHRLNWPHSNLILNLIKVTILKQVQWIVTILYEKVGFYVKEKSNLYISLLYNLNQDQLVKLKNKPLPGNNQSLDFGIEETSSDLTSTKIKVSNYNFFI